MTKNNVTPKMIIQLHQSKFISFLFFSFFFLIKTLNTQPTFSNSYCYTTGNYIANSLYKSNLDSVLSVLHLQSSTKGFYRYNSGSSITTRVYGSYLCRGDISSSTCETCVLRASNYVLILCPNQKEAIIWYEECFLRFSNLEIFSDFDRGPITWRTAKYEFMTYPYTFTAALDNRMDRLIREAYSSSSYFAEETSPTSYLGEVHDLHGLVQCMPDMSQYDCYRCLKTAYNKTEESCCFGNRFTSVYTTNCILTYEAIILTSPPPPPPPRLFSGDSPVDDSDDSFSFKIKGRVFRKIIAPIIAAVVMVLAICLCSFCCYCKKKNEVKENPPVVETSTEMSSTNVAENLPVAQPIAKTESALPN